MSCGSLMSFEVDICIGHARGPEMGVHMSQHVTIFLCGHCTYLNRIAKREEIFLLAFTGELPPHLQHYKTFCKNETTIRSTFFSLPLDTIQLFQALLFLNNAPPDSLVIRIAPTYPSFGSPVPHHIYLTHCFEVQQLNQHTSSQKSWFRGATWVLKNESEKINQIEDYLKLTKLISLIADFHKS